MRTVAKLGFTASALAACPPPPPSGSDAQAAACDVAMMLAPVTSPSPYATVTLRGAAVGAWRLLVGSSNGGNLVPVMVGIDGSFCVDIMVTAPSSQTFTVQALCDVGLLSPSTASAVVTTDPSAPGDPSAATCAGTHP